MGMDIKELKKHKKELQTAISSKVAALVEDFRKKTGQSPSYISIDMLRVEDIGRKPDFIVGNTRVDLEI